MDDGHDVHHRSSPHQLPTQPQVHHRLPSEHRHGRHDLPIRDRLLCLLGSSPLGLCIRDLPHPSSRLRCGYSISNPMALQFLRHQVHSRCHQQYRLEDLYHVRSFLFRKRLFCLFLRQRNKGYYIGGKKLFHAKDINTRVLMLVLK